MDFFALVGYIGFALIGVVVGSSLAAIRSEDDPRPYLLTLLLALGTFALGFGVVGS